MTRFLGIQLWSVLSALAVVAATPAARSDGLSAVQVLREGGCGGVVPAARPLRHNPVLDQAAEAWANGQPLAAAAERTGYRTGSTAGVHVSGPDSSLLDVLRRSECRTVTNQELREIGAYRRGQDTWLVLASTNWLPPSASANTKTPPATSAQGSWSVAPPLGPRAVLLINEARAHGTRCGQKEFAPAPPLTLNGTLVGVALGHATDMAQHDYFEHEDLTGHSPADRVRAVGYHEKLVGENIAYGPATLEEVVKGWLDSPGHCENIMDPRFVEMGIAYAPGQSSRHGLFWVQVFATPKA